MIIRCCCADCIHESVCKYCEQMTKLIRNLGYAINPDAYPVGFHADVIIDCRDYKEV